MLNKCYRVNSAGEYPPPRENALEYPGKRPEHSFILADEMVCPIIFSGNDKLIYNPKPAEIECIGDKDIVTIDDFLEDLEVPPLDARFIVVAYGSNAVPGQLISKFGKDAIVPVIYGNAYDVDIVYNLISWYGAAYAEVLLGQAGIKGNIAVTFLDEDQLKIMNETEENYRLAYMPFDVRLKSGELIKGGKNGGGLIYAGFRKIWVPEGSDAPIAVAELPSINRKLPELKQKDVLELAIKQFSEKLGFDELEIYSATDLANYVKKQKDMKDGPGKLKYMIQEIISGNPNSLKPLVEQVTPLTNPQRPPYVFGDLHINK